MRKEVYEKLCAPIDLQWKPQTCSANGALIVSYIDARDVIKRLNEVFGLGNWQRKYTGQAGKLFCELSFRNEHGEWVTVSDTGNPSDIDPDKGHASDAFKRAAVNIGIGLFIYDTPTVWLDKDMVVQSGNKWVPAYKGKPLNKEQLNRYCNKIIKEHQNA